MVHSADSGESAKRELAFWFEEDREIFEWEPALKDWTTERDDRGDRRAKHSDKGRNSAGGHGISEEELKRAEQAVADAERAVNSLNKADISELKAYHSPPPVVEDIAAAVQILLSNSGRISREKRSWKNFKIIISDPSFMRSLNNFDKQAINADTVKALNDLDRSFDPDYIRKVSAGAAALATWVINMLIFYELIVKPRKRANSNSAGGHGNGISEEDVKRAEQAVADAERAVNSLNKADISELKAYHSPPAVVEDVVSAVQILLANSGRISREKRSWKNFQIMMSDPSSFMRSLNNFDKQAINAETFIALKALDETVNAEGRHKSFDPDNVRKVSAGAAALATWVIGMVTFYELIVEPRSKANSNRTRDERRERRERAAVLP